MEHVVVYLYIGGYICMLYIAVMRHINSEWKVFIYYIAAEVIYIYDDTWKLFCDMIVIKHRG